MKYSLLIQKLHSTGEKYITSDTIREYCAILGISYKEGIVYLIRTRHVYTILRGIFYKPDLEERKYTGLHVSHYEALAEALRIKGVNWYFGLETALTMNNMTHEFFATDYVITDSIFRSKAMNILGNRVRFKKVKPELFTFGIRKNKGLWFSDPEKTVLDIVYLKRYRGEDYMDAVSGYSGSLSTSRLKKYAQHYNKTIEAFVNEKFGRLS